MRRTSSGEPYRVAEVWKQFFALGTDDEAERFQLEERCRFVKTAQNHHSVNLRMFLKGGKKPSSVLASNSLAKQKKCSLFLNTKSYS